MKNMRKLLGAMAALGFATVSTVNVVACGSAAKDPATAISPKVAENLGLTDASGDGLLAPTLIADSLNAQWEIQSSLGAISLTKLLVGNATTGRALAKDQESFDFLHTNLSISLAEGTTLADGKFDAVALGTFTFNEVTDGIFATLSELTNQTDFYFSAGTYDIQVKEGGDNVGQPLSVKIKLGTAADATGVLVGNLPTLVAADVTKPAAFVIGQPKTGVAVGDAVSFASPVTDNDRTLDNIASLIGHATALKVKTVTAAGTNFAAGDKLTIELSFGDAVTATTFDITL